MIDLSSIPMTKPLLVTTINYPTKDEAHQVSIDVKQNYGLQVTILDSGLPSTMQMCKRNTIGLVTLTISKQRICDKHTSQLPTVYMYQPFILGMPDLDLGDDLWRGMLLYIAGLLHCFRKVTI